MKHRSIRLTDGSNLRININFGTLYYIKKEHLDGLMAKEGLTEDEEFELTAKLIYVILRSNGRTVTFDEALMLCPLGTHEIKNMLTEFKNQLNDYKKKEAARKQMKQRYK